MKLSLDYLAHAAVETAKISLPTAVQSYFGQVSDARSTERLRTWASHLLERADVRLDVEGLSNIVPRQSYVVMSNHQSLYDIPILFHTLPLEFRMVAKAELFWVPVWGRAMLASGFVRVDRKRGSEARTELRNRGRELQSRGLSLWIAPEGTRSPDGELLPFKTGGFHLALSLGLPILPVRIDGALRILGKQSGHVTRGQSVRVTVHPPLAISQDSGTSQENADVRFERTALRLRDEVRAILEVSRPEI